MGRVRGAARTGIGLALVLLLAACGSSPDGTGEPTSSAPPPQIQTIDGLVVNTGSTSGSLSAVVSGTAALTDAGCWTLATPGSSTLPLVWPDGTRWADAGHTAVRVPSGGVIGVGTKLTAGGGYIEDVARSSVSIAADVPCIPGDPVSFAVVNADVKPTP